MYKFMLMLFCSCNYIMFIDVDVVGDVLCVFDVVVDVLGKMYYLLCCCEIGVFMQVLEGMEDVIVVCMQEKVLFVEVVVQYEGVMVLIYFVNVCEMGGWLVGVKCDVCGFGVKIVVLLVVVGLLVFDLVLVVDYCFDGNVLIVGLVECVMFWVECLVD